MKKYFILFGLVWSILLAGCHCTSQKALPGIVYSADGVPINYNVYGSGDTALVFIHGWSCDSRYWSRQVDYYAKKYLVVTLDLAGHGHSGLNRKAYTMAAYGADVQEELDGVMQAFEADFMKGIKGFVGTMFVADTDPKLRQWILDDVACAPDFVAKESLKEFFGLYVQGKAHEVFEAVRIPVYCINTDLWPTNSEANQRHMTGYELIIMPGLGHFPMLEAPDKFNPTLDKVLEKALRTPAG